MYCTQRAGLDGHARRSDTFRAISCSVGACTAMRSEVRADRRWSLIADDIPLQATSSYRWRWSACDADLRPEIVIIRRTSDPPSIVMPLDGSAATVREKTTAGS